MVINTVWLDICPISFFSFIYYASMLCSLWSLVSSSKIDTAKQLPANSDLTQRRRLTCTVLKYLNSTYKNYKISHKNIHSIFSSDVYLAIQKPYGSHIPTQEQLAELSRETCALLSSIIHTTSSYFPLTRIKCQ